MIFILHMFVSQKNRNIRGMCKSKCKTVCVVVACSEYIQLSLMADSKSISVVTY